MENMEPKELSAIELLDKNLIVLGEEVNSFDVDDKDRRKETDETYVNLLKARIEMQKNEDEYQLKLMQLQADNENKKKERRSNNFKTIADLTGRLAVTVGSTVASWEFLKWVKSDGANFLDKDEHGFFRDLVGNIGKWFK